MIFPKNKKLFEFKKLVKKMWKNILKLFFEKTFLKKYFLKLFLKTTSSIFF